MSNRNNETELQERQVMEEARKIMKERIKASREFNKDIRLFYLRKLGKNPDERVRVCFNFTSKTPQLFTTIGGLFQKATECDVALDKQTITFEQEFSLAQYKTVIVPLCAAFNISNQQQASLTLNQIK